jgi:hypothetical protein
MANKLGFGIGIKSVCLKSRDGYQQPRVGITTFSVKRRQAGLELGMELQFPFTPEILSAHT